MTEVVIILVALLPAIVLWVYIWRKDSQPEPTSQLIKAVLYGIVIIIPVYFVELAYGILLWGPDGEPSSIVGAFVDAFIVAALPEESFKLFALWFLLRKNPYFDEHFDGIVYAVSIGLGFAAVENVLYLFGNMEEWLSVAVARALLTVPGHYAFAVIMGYYYSVYHFKDHSVGTSIKILLVPVLAHGCYDAIALSGKVEPTIGGFSAIVLILFCIKMHKYVRKEMLEQLDKSRMGT